MLKRFATLCVVSVLGLSLVSTWASAGPVVPDGVHLYFTTRGQTFFREHLGTVLLSNQIDLSKNHWDEMKFVLNEPFKNSPLAESLHAHFAPYFYGFPIHPPKLEVKLTNSDLTVRFKWLGAEIDPAGPEAYGVYHSKGIVLLMRLESDGLQFGVKSLRLNDLANPGLLGILGADSFSSRLSDDSLRTAKAELPVLVEADGKHATMRILAIKTNLTKCEFTSTFEKLYTPSIKMVINDKDYPFDQAGFEKDLRAALPQISTAIATAVNNYFTKDGKATIQAPFDTLAKNLNIDFKLPLGKDDALTIKLRPRTTEYTRARQVGFGFDAEIADSALPAGNDSFATPGTAGRPKVRNEDSNAYDVALALHPAGINGVLERAWAKGALTDIEMGNDDSGHPTKVKIPRAPTVNFENLPRANLANFHAWIGYVVHGIGGILFRGPIPIELDLIVRLETNAKNEIEIVLDHIDESTLRVDTRATWLWPIRRKVNAMVAAKIDGLNKGAKAKRQVVFTLPTLNDLMGIPLHLKSVQTDSGNVVLLAEFAPKP